MGDDVAAFLYRDGAPSSPVVMPTIRATPGGFGPHPLEYPLDARFISKR